MYVDQNDNLYGEGGYYDDKADKFYQYLWVYHPNGKIDTVIGLKQAYVNQNFALARDKKGNEYYIKRFLAPHTDTNNLYRRSPEGREIIMAKGNYRNVNWLHPQNDGSLLYVLNNAVYSIDSVGNTRLLKDRVGNTKPSAKFSGNNIMIWGVWQDAEKNTYAAVFSDQAVKKIDVTGKMTTVYTSTGSWAPLHGVFDDTNKLWVLEVSDKNEVRVTSAEMTSTANNEENLKLAPLLITSCIAAGFIIFYFGFRRLSTGLSNLKS